MLGDRDLAHERPLIVTRRSLYYTAGYLLLGGAGLVLSPQSTLALLMSTATYGGLLPRLGGLIMMGLGLFVVDLIRGRREPLYPAALVVSGIALIGLIAVYVLTLDPLFLTLITIVGLGFVLTTASYTVDHSRSART